MKKRSFVIGGFSAALTHHIVARASGSASGNSTVGLDDRGRILPKLDDKADLATWRQYLHERFSLQAHGTSQDIVLDRISDQSGNLPGQQFTLGFRCSADTRPGLYSLQHVSGQSVWVHLSEADLAGSRMRAEFNLLST